jgi:hypothetical protein
MRLKRHIAMLASCLATAFFLRATNAEALTVSEPFLLNGNGIALFVYTLLFMAVAYAGYWIYMRGKNF